MHNPQTAGAIGSTSLHSRMPARYRWSRKQRQMLSQSKSAAAEWVWRERPRMRRKEKVKRLHTADRRSTQARKARCASRQKENYGSAKKPECRISNRKTRRMQESNCWPCANHTANRNRKTVPRNKLPPSLQQRHTCLCKLQGCIRHGNTNAPN